MDDKQLASLKRKTQYLNKGDYKMAVRIAELAAEVPALIAEVERLRAERDAAQARAERWIKLHKELGESYDRVFTDASQLEQERDAARAR